MSKILDSGCSKKKKMMTKKHPPFFSQENHVFYLYYAKEEKICLKTEHVFTMQKHFHFFRS